MGNVQGLMGNVQGLMDNVQGLMDKDMSERYFENLQIWQEARTLVNEVYDIMEPCHDYGFKDQIQRAAISIMNDIAEGQESGSDAKFTNFLYIAKGSCGEVRSMLYICDDRNFCTHDKYNTMMDHCISISRKIYRLIEAINKRNSTKSPNP